MRNKTWYEITAKGGDEPAYISIYGDIGDWGITASDFERDLRALGRPKAIDLHLNTRGGDVFQGNAIHAMLHRLSAAGTTITVYIDGAALSMGSLIAMAGDEIVMPSNSIMMIHNPSGGVLGTSKDMREWAAVLDKLSDGMVTVYAARSKKTRDEIQDIMDAETWYGAAEAVAAGFADRVESSVAIAAKFDLSHFRNPPTALAGDAGGGITADTEEADLATSKDQQQETAAQMEARIRAEVTKELTDKAAADAAAKDKQESAPAPLTAEAVAKMIADAITASQATKTDAQSQTDADAAAAAALKAKDPTAQINNHGSEGQDAGDAPVVFKSLDSVAIMARYNGKKAA